MADELEIVNLKDISNRWDVAYIRVQKWWRRERGSTPLPGPITLLGWRNPIWQWETIVQWCHDTGRGRLVE